MCEIELFVLIEVGWVLDVDCDVIFKIYKFKNFIDVFGFMIWVVIWVEKWVYYLEWFNVYNCVEVMLMMYDVGGFSVLDMKFVCKMDVLVG